MSSAVRQIGLIRSGQVTGLLRLAVATGVALLAPAFRCSLSTRSARLAANIAALPFAIPGLTATRVVRVLGAREWSRLVLSRGARNQLFRTSRRSFCDRGRSSRS